MEKTNQQLNESLAKMKNLMQYDLKTTLLENEETIEEQSARKLARQARKSTFQANKDAGMSGKEARGIKKATRQDDRAARKADDTSDEVLDDNYEADFEGEVLKNINRFVKRINKGAGKIEKAMARLEASTYNGGSAVEAAKALYQEKYQQPMPMLGGTAVAPSPAPASTWKPSYPKCQGGINKVGCRSNAIGKVQAALDDIGVDGKFGPETQKRLAAVAPEFGEQFTDADVPAIRAKIKAANAPREIAPGKISMKQATVAGVAPKPRTDVLDPSRITQANEQGATNMAIGFMNESVSNKEQKRINKEVRLNKKLGITL